MNYEHLREESDTRMILERFKKSLLLTYVIDLIEI